MMAEIPQIRPDILMIESTYGVSIHEPRESRESRFTKTVKEIVSRGGRCLIPVFALGRAQELLLILGEFWGIVPLVIMLTEGKGLRVCSGGIYVAFFLLVAMMIVDIDHVW